MKVLRMCGLPVLMVFFLLAGVSSAAGGSGEHYDKGVEYASEGKFIQAREEFKEALKMDPRHSPSQYSLKSIEDAIDSKVKKEAVMHFFKGAAFGNKGMWDKSITGYTKAIEIDPEYAAAYYNRGNAYHEKGRHDRAISDYTKAIEIDPEDAVAYYNRGNAYKKKGRYDRVISDYTKAIEIDPEYAAAYYNRGNAYKRKGRYDRAVSDYTKAIVIDPRIADAYNNRGFIYMVEFGEKTKACTDWKLACGLGECGNYEFAKRNGDCG